MCHLTYNLQNNNSSLFNASRYENGMKTPTLSEAIASLLESKTRLNFRPRYITSLRRYLTQFARERETELVSTITVCTLENWFAVRNEAPSSMLSNLGRLSALFSFCWRRGWIESNPCDRLERPRIDEKVPQILTLAQVEDILEHTAERAPAHLGWLVLSIFAGIRPDETLRLSWNDISLDTAVVTVDASASKVRRRRIVTLSENAVEWLRFAQELGAVMPVRPQRRKRWLHHLRARLQFETWPTDALRHTSASFMLSQSGDAGKVATQLGNSVGILWRNYKELVSREDATRFWSLLPRRRPVKHATCTQS